MIEKMDVSGAHSAIYAIVMDKASIFALPARFGPFEKGSIWPASLTVLLVLCAVQLLALWSTKQRLVPGIFVVGGSGKDQIKESRSRFVHDSRSMVLEGYQKVSSGREAWSVDADTVAGR